MKQTLPITICIMLFAVTPAQASNFEICQIAKDVLESRIQAERLLIAWRMQELRASLASGEAATVPEEVKTWMEQNKTFTKTSIEKINALCSG